MKAIRVRFNDDSTGYVKETELDELITARKIKSFLRSNGWVRIGVDPIRSTKDHRLDRRASPDNSQRKE